MKQLNDKVAIITGASSGIGIYIAKRLAKEGVRLALVARSGEKLQQIAREIDPNPANVLALTANITDTDALRRVTEEVERHFGRLDILVNNAGLEITARLEDLNEDEIMQLVDVNLTAHLQFSRIVLPIMLKQGSGHVVNVSSMAAKLPTAYHSVYASAKAGLSAFTRAWRTEYHDQGVSASVLLLGAVDKVGMMKQMQDDSGAKPPSASPLAQPESVADAVVNAIVNDKIDVIVMPGPGKLMTVLTEIFPSLGQWMVKKLGINEFMATVATARHGLN